MKKIKLMAEYSIDFPLWDIDGVMASNDLNISQELKEELQVWSSQVDGWLDMDDPSSTKIDPIDWIIHDCNGIILLKRLQYELGEGFLICFQSWALNETCNEIEFLKNLCGKKYQQ